MDIWRKWVPFAFLVTLFAGLVYVAVQQSYRMSANDPQIAMAEDAARALASSNATGTALLGLVPKATVDIANSLSPFMVIYDESGRPIAGNGTINGSFPNLPSGIFDYTRAAGEDRVTWETAAGIRSAIVIVHIQSGSGGFVMAGRSLREIELREGRLETYVGAAWLFALIGTLVLVAYVK